MKREKTQRLNDGYAVFYKENPNKKIDFSTKAENISKISNAEKIVELAFAEETRRDQDYEFAKANDRSLNLKIRTLFKEGITTKDVVVIRGVLYSIIKLDYATKDGVMYFYLEEDRELVESD